MMASSAAATPNSTTEKRDFRDLPPAEVLLEVEGGPHRGDDLPANFMTLDEARTSGCFDQEVLEKLSEVWSSVVQVVVPATTTENGISVPAIGRGTGFVTFGPGHSKQVLTNYHVLEDYQGDLSNYQCQPAISVRFFFDTPDQAGVKTHDVISINYFSVDSGVVEIVDKDNCDFALLSIENIPPNVNGITLSPSGKHKLEVLQSRLGLPMNQGIVIGHPQGSYKRISTVDLQSSSDDFVQMYTTEGTQRGSSGSPVVINCGSSADVAYFLHRHTGGGINAKQITDIIRRDPKTEPVMEKVGKQFQHKVNEMFGN